MKVLIFKKINLFLCLSVGLLIFISSCTKKTELLPSDEDFLGELLTASSSFNWNTSKTIDVRIGVDDSYDGKYFYKLEIFDREPHLSGAVLLGAGVAKKGQDLITKVTIPTNLAQLFVQKTTPTGEVSYSILEVKDLNGIGASKIASAAKLASLNTSGLKKMASTSLVVPSVPNDALEITGSADITTVPASKVYLIKSGEWFSGNIPALDQSGVNGVVVYVQGKWHHTKPIEIGENSKIVVLPGGELNVSALNMNDGTASFESHGDVLLNSLKINANNSFVNIGTLKIVGAVSMVGAAEFINYQKEVKVKVGSLTMRDKDCVVTNDGEIEILTGTFNNGTLNANCYTTVGNMSENNATINIRQDAMLDVTNLKALGGVFNLDLGAVLDVTRVANFQNEANKPVVINSFSPDVFKKAYVRIKYVRVPSSDVNHLTYAGNLIVVTDEHPFRSENKFTIEANSAVEIFWDRYNHPPYVARTNCNNGGIGTIPTTPPVDQTPTAIKLGAYSYFFEDNWPNIGDFDMNDIVLDVEVVRFQNQENKVVKVVLKNKIRSVGASKRLAAAIQLDNVLASNVKSVVYSNTNVVGVTLPLKSTGVEDGQTNAVVTVVDDAHKAFGLTNTSYVSTQNTNVLPFETDITIEFNTPLASFTQDDLNPFIVSISQISTSTNPNFISTRPEVHLVGRKGTDKINRNMIINGQTANGLLSSIDPFKTKENLPFAISVPTSIKYSRETRKITVSYPNFINWVNSGGTSYLDWYTNYVE